MAITVTYEDGEQESQWIDKRFTLSQSTLKVVRVTTSGDELKRALEITGFPQYGSLMMFYGDTAKHIVGNWFN